MPAKGCYDHWGTQLRIVFEDCQRWAKIMKNVHYPKVAPVGYYVYLFVIDGIPRYIGKGQRDRYSEHIRVVRRGTGKSMWYTFLKKSMSAGREIVVEIIADGLTSEQAKNVEIDLIAKHGRRAMGCGTLMNVSAGGDGIDSEVAKEIHSRPGMKEKIGRAISAAAARPEVKQLRMRSLKEAYANPEVIRRVSNAVRKALQRSEVKERHSNGVRSSWAKPEERERRTEAILKANRNPEVRARHVAANRRIHADPTVQAKRAAIRADPLFRERHAAATKAAMASPEIKEKVAAGLLKAWSRPELRKRAKDSANKRFSAQTERDRVAMKTRLAAGTRKAYCAEKGIAQPGKGYCNIDKEDFKRWLVGKKTE
jgi:hypothetical protein